jgi:phosphatidylglycerol---prolipoprotein diacylglyceryl transferase
MNSPDIVAYIYWNVNPDAFTIPFIDHPVRWYGLFFAGSLVISQLIMTHIYKKEGRTVAEVDTLAIYVVVATIVGARMGHVLFYDPAFYFQHPGDILKVWEGGLASHGGGIGVIAALYLFARKTKVAYLWILDRVVIVAALTGCLIRLGNLMNSEMIGLPTSMPWGFVFESVDNIPRHPAQLYEALFCFVLFVVSFVAWYKYRSRLQNGFLFSWFLILLFTFRFIDEFFKINQEPFEDGMLLNMGQLLSIPFILAGIAILVINARKKNLTARVENPNNIPKPGR